MGSIGYTKDELVGLRVVRGPNWEWDTQDGGEGSVGTVVGIVKNIQISRRVKVRWDSGQEYIYRIGAEGAYDLRVLDNSAVGVKHPGVECRGCGQKDIAGMRWQCFHCFDCPMPMDLCTFCFTNGKHEQTHVIFQRYDRPSNPIVVHLVSDQPRIPLKGFFPGALVRRDADWKYGAEDGASIFSSDHSLGKMVPAPTDCVMTPGNVWVQWPDEMDKSYPYRMGFSGKMDFEMAKAGIGGQYQPITLPVLVISKPRADEKTNDVIAEHPFVVGDRVKVVVGLEELREMAVDCGIGWNAGKMKKVVNEIFIIKEIDNKNNTAKVSGLVLSDLKRFRLPVKALRRSIPWLPVGAVVQVINKSHSNGMDKAQDWMAGDFGRVKQVNLDGKTVKMEFFTFDGNVIKTIPVSQLQDKHVDVSVIEKVDSIRKDLAKLLLSEVEKGSILSVQYLLKTYPEIINCQSPYNGRNCTALSVACQKGNVEMVKLLLTHKASVDIADERDDDDGYNSYEDSDDDDDDQKGKKPIEHAVIRNHPEVLRLLLQNGPSLTDTKWNSRTPLHLAAINGHIACVRVLLEDERCDLYFEDCVRDTAFLLAVETSVQSVELFNLFRATGRLNIFEKNYCGKNLFHFAAEHNNLGLVNFLLSCPEGKKFACERDDYGNTPLFIACRYGHNQIAKLLVSYLDKIEDDELSWGIDTPNEKGETPLIIVLEKFNHFLIELLIGAGANLQAKDKKGDTPFHYAARLYREKGTTFKRTIRRGAIFISWPNQEIAPAIFKLYNELKKKHPGENLPPIAAIVCYLVAKGGIPQNLTLPEIKNLIGENFLYGEIIKFSHDQLNSMSQNFDNQGNPLQDSPPVEWSGTNGVAVGAVHNGEIADENQLSMPSPLSVFNEEESDLEAKLFQELIGLPMEDLLIDFVPDLEQQPRDPVSSISQQHPPSSEHQSNDSGSIFPIPNENVPVPVTPTVDAAANTFAANGVGDYHLTPSDNNGSISATIDVPYIDETINSQGASISMSNEQPTADTSTADSAATGSTRPPEEVTCTFEEKHFLKRKGGLAEEKTSLIIIDESGRRYSQQKKDVSDIFQCTANVSTPNKPNGSKKCKGTIDVQDLAGKKEEYETNPGKKFTFKVRNAHEEHLPRKRGRQSTETESDVPSTRKRKKKI